MTAFGYSINVSAPEFSQKGSIEAEPGKPHWEFWEPIQVSTGDLVAHVFPESVKAIGSVHFSLLAWCLP